MGAASPRAVEDQELLLHEKAVGDNRSCATGSQELGEGGQQMCEEYKQVLRGEIAYGKSATGTRLTKLLFS